jgi:opacity protein-like surface antigen
MFTKIFKLFMSLMILGLLITNYSYSQTSNTKIIKKPYPVYTISPLAGAIFPLSELSNNYRAGFTAGLDLGVRLNHEVALYTTIGYHSLTGQNSDIPKSNYLEVSAGPRYYFTSPKLQSKFFIETGVGAYSNSQDAYTMNGVTTGKVSQTNVGINVGPGATLQLSNSMDVILKTKYHMIFNGGGTRSFVNAMGGLEFKF